MDWIKNAFGLLFLTGVLLAMAQILTTGSTTPTPDARPLGLANPPLASDR